MGKLYNRTIIVATLSAAVGIVLFSACSSLKTKSLTETLDNTNRKVASTSSSPLNTNDQSQLAGDQSNTSPVIDMAATRSRACALLSNHNIECWNFIDDIYSLPKNVLDTPKKIKDQQGKFTVITPTQLGGTPSQLILSYDHSMVPDPLSCALTENGIKCWDGQFKSIPSAYRPNTVSMSGNILCGISGLNPPVADCFGAIDELNGKNTAEMNLRYPDNFFTPIPNHLGEASQIVMDNSFPDDDYRVCTLDPKKTTVRCYGDLFNGSSEHQFNEPIRQIFTSVGTTYAWAESGNLWKWGRGATDDPWLFFDASKSKNLLTTFATHTELNDHDGYGDSITDTSCATVGTAGLLNCWGTRHNAHVVLEGLKNVRKIIIEHDHGVEAIVITDSGIKIVKTIDQNEDQIDTDRHNIFYNIPSNIPVLPNQQ